MVKRIDRVFWLVYVKLKKPFNKEKSSKNFETNLIKYRNKEDPIKTPSTKKQGKNSLPHLISLKVWKDHVDFIYTGPISTSKLRKADRLVNKLISFVDVSIGIKKIRVNVSRDVRITELPIVDFINKTTIAKLNSTIKQSFIPVGMILETKSLPSEFGNGKSLVMLINLEKEKILDITLTLDFTDKDRWDLLRTSDTILNKLKKNLISGLKVKEK